ncbi:hypothetical protein BGZ83_010973 [Gryganskiella cystojenkinii]|nr:hypothetical protein BGZ83_010973 [Gryganskiella cystojenkinii]
MFRRLLTLAAIANLATAYYWQAELGFGTDSRGNQFSRMCIKVVDSQVPSNYEKTGGCAISYLPDGKGSILFADSYYDPVVVAADIANPGLSYVTSTGPQPKYTHKGQIPCSKMDEYSFTDAEKCVTYPMQVYNCAASNYYGLKGDVIPPLPVSNTTTSSVAPSACPTKLPTTLATPSTSSMPATSAIPITNSTTVATGPIVTTASAIPTIATTVIRSTAKTVTTAAPKPTCTSGYRGKKTGKGPTRACCSSSDDCQDTCFKGVCGVHP